MFIYDNNFKSQASKDYARLTHYRIEALTCRLFILNRLMLSHLS